MTDTLPAFPELRALAEAQARALYGAFPSQRGPFPARDGCGLTVHAPTPWEEQGADFRASLIDAHLALLRDLSRPESRDAVARLLAAKVGLACGATAPGWYSDDDGGRRHRRWYLEFVATDPHADERTFYDPNVSHGGVSWVAAPSISTVTDPAEALRLAVVAVWGITTDSTKEK